MRFQALHLHVVRLNWEGKTNDEIATALRRSAQWVRDVLNSPEAQDIYAKMAKNVLDTSIQVQGDLQAIAPLALARKVNIMLNGSDNVANRAAQELLEMAGHVATRQVEIRRPDGAEETYRNKSEAEIRKDILDSIIDPQRTAEKEADVPETLH